MEDRKFQFPLNTIKKAKQYGLSLVGLKAMVVRSARITHTKGNRRHMDYLLNVIGDKVTDIYQMSRDEILAEERRTTQVRLPKEVTPIRTFYKCETCRDTGKMQVFNECEACLGVGCRRCDDGLVPAQVTCPDCHDRNYIGVYQRPRKFRN